jgi:leader peptidase (prepilin peptidase)/N-methyltransferase
MSFVLELCALLLGLLFGSFLNVCISRMPDHRSVIQPRSHCPICEHPIRWYDNVPVLSWLLLRGRCRDCGAAISWRYPVVELAVGLIFAYAISLPLHVAHTTPDATTAILKMSLTAVGVAAVGFCLIGLMVSDWQTHRLPDGLTLSGMVIGFLLVCVQA